MSGNTRILSVNVRISVMLARFVDVDGFFQIDVVANDRVTLNSKQRVAKGPVCLDKHCRVVREFSETLHLQGETMGLLEIILTR